MEIQQARENGTEDWERVRLKEICRVESGGNAPQGEEYFKDGKHPFVRVQHFDGTRNYVDRWDLINDKAVKDYRLKPFPRGSIVFPKSGASIRLEKRAMLPFDCFVVSHLAVLTPNRNRVDSEFLLYLLKTVKLASRSGGTTLPYLNLSNIEELLVLIPPLAEQRKIAFVLSKIQQAIEQQDKIIEATKNLKRSLMQKLFTEGTRRKEQKESELGLIPEDWQLLKLKDVCDLKNGINFTREQKGNTGMLTVDVLNMYNEGLYVNLQNLYRVNKKIPDEYLLRKGDILFVRSSLKKEGVGWACLFKDVNEPVTFCGFIIRARLKSPNIFPEFLAYFLRSIIVREKLISSSGKVTITNVNQGMLGTLAIPIPPLHEQREIANTLSLIDKKIEIEERRKATLEQLFKTTLNKLMTGEIRVKDLDLGVINVS